MALSSTWFLLEQEGLLCHACLCNGLTALRRANLGDKKGLFYSAFFELSIGFERMLKLVLILDHMARNQLVPPDGKRVRGYSHKLSALFAGAKVICTARRVIALDGFGQDSLPITILNFLDEFADTSGRYFNINKLIGDKKQSMSDPIEKWGEIAHRIMSENATPDLASAAFGDVALNFINDMNQQQLDVGPLFARSSQLDSSSSHAIYALVTLIAALREVIDSVCSSARTARAAGVTNMIDIPDMKEFFLFATGDKRYVLRKRMWP